MLFRDKDNNKELTPTPPEGVDKKTFYSIHYLKHWKKNILSWRHQYPLPSNPEKSPDEYVADFDDLGPVIDALELLNEHMEIGDKGDSLIKNLAFFATKCAGETRQVLTDITHLTVKSKEPMYRSRRMYWLGSLKELFTRPDSLNGMAGTYDIYVPLGKESTTGGAAELKQGVDNISLHFADITAKKATTPTDPAFEQIRVKQLQKTRQVHVDDATRLLQQAAQDGRVPVTSSRDYYSHDSDLRLHQGEAIRRTNLPSQDRVRLLRPSIDGKSGYYNDMSKEEFDQLDNEELRNMLKPSDSEGWIHFKDGLNIWDKEKEPPAYSISAGANEHEYTEVQKAGACGNSKVHLDYSYGLLIVQPGHVAENGASAKLGEAGIGISLQNRKSLDEPLAKHSLPLTEIRPPYTKTDLPRKAFLKILGNQPQVVKQTLDFFGLSNMRIRFGDITPENTANLTEILDTLNGKYIAPRRESLKKFIEEHQDPSTPMDDEIEQEILNLFAPEFTLDELFTIGASQSLGNLSVAGNMLQNDIEAELAHNSVPRMPVKNGKFDIDDQEWIHNYLADKELAQFGLNIFNVYKYITQQWSETPIVGAKALGKIFSPALAKYMELRLHHSTLGSAYRWFGDKVAYFAGFDTAKPMPTQPLANALSTLITEGENGYSVKAAFRDNLTPEMLTVLPFDSRYFPNILDQVTTELTRNYPNTQAEIKQKAISLKDQWIKNYQEMEDPSRTQAFMDLVKSNFQELQAGDPTVYRAFQIFLTAGDRLYRTQMLSQILRMEI